MAIKAKQGKARLKPITSWRRFHVHEVAAKLNCTPIELKKNMRKIGLDDTNSLDQFIEVIMRFGRLRLYPFSISELCAYYDLNTDEVRAFIKKKNLSMSRAGDFDYLIRKMIKRSGK
jgi:hypothetical protein